MNESDPPNARNRPQRWSIAPSTPLGMLDYRKPVGLEKFFRQTTHLNDLLSQDPTTISDPSDHRAALRKVLDQLTALGTGLDAECYLAALGPLESMRAELAGSDAPDDDITDQRWHLYIDLVRTLRPNGVDVYAAVLELRYPRRAARARTDIPRIPDFRGLVADALRDTPVDEVAADRLAHRGASDRLIALAARLLPPEERPRYVEELRANLLDLNKWERLRYALSLLRGAVQLRNAITETNELRSAVENDQNRS